MITRVIIANLQRLAFKETRRQLEHALCERYGGFTCTRVQGGWLSPTGETMLETGLSYEVGTTMEPANPEYFLTAARAIGEQSIFYETRASVVEIINT